MSWWARHAEGAHSRHRRLCPPYALIAVAAIDWISGKLRFAIIGKRAVV
jgi:hypothetical protein